jgi:hypothetical protein
MTIGLIYTKSQLDALAGDIAISVAKDMRRIQELEHFLNITPDAILIALGYVQAEVSLLKSGFIDADKLRTIYEGSVALPATQDFRLNLLQLGGPLVT